MGKEQCKRAALLRGIIFDGIKTCRGSEEGRMYEILAPNCTVLRAKSLDDIYKLIMTFPKLKKSENTLYKLYIRGVITI